MQRQKRQERPPKSGGICHRPAPADRRVPGLRPCVCGQAWPFPVFPVFPVCPPRSVCTFLPACPSLLGCHFLSGYPFLPVCPFLLACPSLPVCPFFPVCLFLSACMFLSACPFLPACSFLPHRPRKTKSGGLPAALRRPSFSFRKKCKNPLTNAAIDAIVRNVPSKPLYCGIAKR